MRELESNLENDFEYYDKEFIKLGKNLISRCQIWNIIIKSLDLYYYFFFWISILLKISYCSIFLSDRAMIDPLIISIKRI